MSRDREDIERMLRYVEATLPIYRRRVEESQLRLDQILRERDQALARLAALPVKGVTT